MSSDIADLRNHVREDIRDLRNDLHERLAEHTAESKARHAALEAAVTSLAAESRAWQAQTSATLSEATTKIRLTGAVAAMIAGALVSFALDLFKGCGVEPARFIPAPDAAHAREGSG